MSLIRPGALAAALLLFASRTSAQDAVPTLNLMLGGMNAYVWRGATLADQASLQGEVSVALPVGRGSFTGGAWAVAEIAPDEERFSSLTQFETGIGEVDLYAQYAQPAGPATLAVGVTALRFPEIPEWHTFEVYGSVAFPGAPLAPSLIVRKDVDAVGGAYAELGLSRAVPVGGRTLNLGAVVGASTGQDEDGDVAWYAGEGLTHAVVSAATTFTSGGLAWTPLVNLTYGFDDFTEVNGKEARVGVGLNVSRAIPLR